MALAKKTIITILDILGVKPEEEEEEEKGEKKVVEKDLVCKNFSKGIKRRSDNSISDLECEHMTKKCKTCDWGFNRIKDLAMEEETVRREEAELREKIAALKRRHDLLTKIIETVSKPTTAIILPNGPFRKAG